MPEAYLLPTSLPAAVLCCTLVISQSQQGLIKILPAGSRTSMGLSLEVELLLCLSGKCSDFLVLTVGRKGGEGMQRKKKPKRKLKIQHCVFFMQQDQSIYNITAVFQSK